MPTCRCTSSTGSARWALTSASSRTDFRIPSDGAVRRLRLILTPEEVESATILDPPQRPTRKPKPQPESFMHVVNNEAELSEKKRKQGEGARWAAREAGGHGHMAAGASRELLLSQWESSHGTIIKAVVQLRGE